MTSDFTKALFKTISDRGDADFWVSPVQTHSYADLHRMIRQVCGVFDEWNAKDNAAVQIVTSDDWLGAVVFLAAILDGKRPLVLAPDAGVARLAGIAERTGPGIKIIDPELSGDEWTYRALIAGNVTTARAAFDRDNEHGIWEDVLARANPRDPKCDSDGDQTAYLLFTSGTTNRPKGVEVSIEGLAQQLSDITRVFELSSESRLFNALVLYHTDGLIQGPVLAAFAGACLLRPRKFALDRLAADLDWMVAQNATHMISVPMVYSMIERHIDADHYFNRPEFKGALSTAAPLDDALWERFEAKFSTALVNEYGMTETVAASHFAGPHPEMGARLTIGKPIGCEASVQDETGAPVAAGDQGELCLRGPIIFKQYIDDPERTKNAFRDGWFRTGDLACVNADGSYVLVGRMNSVINSGGFNIQPEEIDQALMSHPAVDFSKTVGIPHPEFGFIPVTAAILQEPVPETELYAHCRDTLETWKQPRRIVFVDQVPRTASGKVELQKLSEQLADAMSLDVDPSQTVPDRLLTLAAIVFNVEKDELSFEDGPDEIESWDSFTHMTFAVEIEKTFDIKLKPRDLVDLETLGEFRDVIVDRSAA